MHELAEGLRRARQLRRPLGGQPRSANFTDERPLRQPDRDAGWARRRVAPAAQALEPASASQEQPSLPQSTASHTSQETVGIPAQSETLPELPPASAKAGLDSGDMPTQDAEMRDATTQQSTEPIPAHPAGASTGGPQVAQLIRIDCKPKTLRQALAGTVVRFFAASYTPRQESAPALHWDPPSSKGSPRTETAVQSSPRRGVLHISRFQANVTAALQRSDPLRASSEVPALELHEDVAQAGGAGDTDAEVKHAEAAPIAVDTHSAEAGMICPMATVDVPSGEPSQDGLTSCRPSGTNTVRMLEASCVLIRTLATSQLPRRKVRWIKPKYQPRKTISSRSLPSSGERRQALASKLRRSFRASRPQATCQVRLPGISNSGRSRD